MPASRNHYVGPSGPLSYSQHYGSEHFGIVNDEREDPSFTSKVSNFNKSAYICKALRFPPKAFYLDVPFPIEDWAMGGEYGLLTAGLYLSDLRRQFYGKLLREGLVPENSPVWTEHAKAEFWCYAFNFAMARHSSCSLPPDTRVLN